MEKPIAFSFRPQKINSTIEKENTLNYDLKETKKTITLSFESQKIDYTIKKGNVLTCNLKEITTVPTEFKQGFEGLKSVEYERLEIKGKNGVVTSTLLPYPTTLKGVGTARDTLEVVEQDNGLYRIDKVVRCEETDYTSGDEDNANYLTNLIKTIKPLPTPTTTTIETDLTKEELMPILELGGSVDIINSNSEFVNGSTTIEMVYRKIN